MANKTYKHIFVPAFISGLMFGIEFHLGEDLDIGDKFAMTIDFFIVRLTYIITTGNRYDTI